MNNEDTNSAAQCLTDDEPTVIFGIIIGVIE